MSSATATVAAGGRMAPASPVLVVEDDPDIRELLRLRIARQRHDVVEAASGEEAIDLARKQHPALVVLDILLPGIDGWEVLVRLRDDPDLRDVPVLVVSVLDDLGESHRPPVDGYLTKPFRKADVDRALRELLPDAPPPPSHTPRDPGGAP